MPETEKPKLSAELLHQLLGEHVEKAGQTLRRHEQLELRTPIYFGAMAFMIVMALFLTYFLMLDPELPNLVLPTLMIIISVLVLVISVVAMAAINSAAQGGVLKQDLALTVWQLRRIYELASRYEDTGPEIEPALRMGIVLKLGEAQLLLTQLEKFEAKDGRFEHMRSLGPDPLKIQSREELRPSVATDLATTER
jgi:hypothetical protein